MRRQILRVIPLPTMNAVFLELLGASAWRRRAENIRDHAHAILWGAIAVFVFITPALHTALFAMYDWCMVNASSGWHLLLLLIMAASLAVAMMSDISYEVSLGRQLAAMTALWGVVVGPAPPQP